MKQDIHLFIGSKEVEFSSDPKILFNFKLTEFENPTIVRNTWTKSVEIPSTPSNDDIFNHYWNLERVNGGVNFNAMVKTPFSLYINNTLFQNGYAKLDSVKMQNHSITYSLSLFGGLGDFFYNLSYNQGSLGDEKKTLGSLNFVTDYIKTEPDLNFVINKEFVHSAWTRDEDIFKVINFAPCYNGIPGDFDANKVLINNRGNNHGVFLTESEGYMPIYNGSRNADGYSLGEASEDLTCDETFDLRSYLQRPVVNVQRVLQACFHPSNNGGYQVKLDNHFFHDDNPYWTKGWCTLPMLRDLEVEGGQSEKVTGATVSSVNRNRKNISFNSTSLSQIDNVRIRLNVGLKSNSSLTGTSWYSYRYYSSSAPSYLPFSQYVRYYQQNFGAVFMLVGRDSNGVVCAKSKAYCLSSNGNSIDGHPVWNNFHVDGYPDPDEIVYMSGYWKKINNQWRFCNMAGQQVDIEFTFPGAAPIATLEIVTQTNGGAKWRNKGLDAFTIEMVQDYPDLAECWVWPSMEEYDNELKTPEQVLEKMVQTEFTYNITDFYAVATDYEALFSNTYIPKERLLSTSYTPAEFMISYCKMFGLYFYRDPAEESDDPDSCPKGVIHIMDRDTFFTDDYVDIDDLIDYSRQMTITPTLAGSKWYSFEQDGIDSEAGDAYKGTYGYIYGRQLVNTNYNFDNGTTNLLDKGVFKSGVMVWEKDKYYAMPVSLVPVYGYNGFKYNLFSAGTEGFDSTELEVETKVWNKTDINTFGLKGYDSFPKLQCHTEDNSSSDGDGVLLFYNGIVQTANDYWITDDLLEMQTLNGNACWLMPGGGLDALGNRIGIQTNNLPQYTRDLINFGLQQGNIVCSWNFGHPQVTFSPNTYTTDGDSIYDKCWKDYIGDLYNQDNKKLSCYVNLRGTPANEWLRKWYWFQNSLWRLNEIKDYNAADFSTTLCEFVKVMDVDNYKLTRIDGVGYEKIVLDSNAIGRSGGTIGGQVILQSGGDWFTEDGLITGTDMRGGSHYAEGAIRPYTGHGQTSNITVTFPPNSGSAPITWRVCVEGSLDGENICAQVTQEGDNSPYIEFMEGSRDVTVSNQAQSCVLYYNFVNIVPETITASSSSYWVSMASINPQSNSLTVMVEDSNAPYQRTATIEISGAGVYGGTASATMTLKQTGNWIDVYPAEIDFDYNSTTGSSISITASTAWIATIEDNNGE